MKITPWLLAICLCSPLVSSAEPVSPKGEANGKSRFELNDRLLQAGDKLEINILAIPELERSYFVRADGTFFHPYAGEVVAAGKTLKQLENLLRLRFSKELRSPQFRLGLVTTAECEASVLGEVHSQGRMKFLPGASVLDLLAQAGGVSERADTDRALLLRSGKEIPLNLGPGSQGMLARTMVQDGDILYVNRGKRVGVSGEVQLKGVFSIGSESNNSVEDAVKNAGGATDTAALNRIQVVRPSLATPLIVNLLDPASAKSTVLEDGDTVIVPSRNVVLLGAVSKQGQLPITLKTTLVDVVSQAGGGQGNLASVVVVRYADVLAATDKKEVYDLEGALTEGQSTVNVPISDGDLVYIPPKELGALGGMSMINLLMMARSFFAF